MQTTQFVCIMLTLVISAASECGTDPSCAADKDAAALLQGPVTIQSGAPLSSQKVLVEEEEKHMVRGKVQAGDAEADEEDLSADAGHADDANVDDEAHEEDDEDADVDGEAEVDDQVRPMPYARKNYVCSAKSMTMQGQPWHGNPSASCPCEPRFCDEVWSCIRKHQDAASYWTHRACDKVLAKTATRRDELCCGDMMAKCQQWKPKCFYKVVWNYCLFPKTVKRSLAPPEFRNAPCQRMFLLEGNGTRRNEEVTLDREQEKESKLLQAVRHEEMTPRSEQEMALLSEQGKEFEQGVSLDASLSGKRC